LSCGPKQPCSVAMVGVRQDKVLLPRNFIPLAASVPFSAIQELDSVLGRLVLANFMPSKGHLHDYKCGDGIPMQVEHKAFPKHLQVREKAFTLLQVDDRIDVLVLEDCRDFHILFLTFCRPQQRWTSGPLLIQPGQLAEKNSPHFLKRKWPNIVASRDAISSRLWKETVVGQGENFSHRSSSDCHPRYNCRW